MKKYIIFLFIVLKSCGMAYGQKLTHKVQDFKLNPVTGYWERSGSVYSTPDTLTITHGYKWKREKIIAIQDYRKVNGKWEKYGEPYPLPDTLKIIHAFIK